MAAEITTETLDKLLNTLNEMGTKKVNPCTFNHNLVVENDF